ncbi:DNA gyrase inhibitor YacG [Hydrogenophaga soli]
MPEPTTATTFAATWVDCPACKQSCEYSPQNPYRPFCSKLCRATDLGRWAQEDFRIDAEAPSEDSQ